MRVFDRKNDIDMYTAIKGIYGNGVLTLLEPAPNLTKSEVLATFLDRAANRSEPQPWKLKKREPGGLLRLAHLEGKTMSVPNDFNDPIDNIFDLD